MNIIIKSLTCIVYMAVPRGAIISPGNNMISKILPLPAATYTLYYVSDSVYDKTSAGDPA